MAVVRERLIWALAVPLALLGVVGLLLLGGIEAEVCGRAQETLEEV